MSLGLPEFGSRGDQEAFAWRAVRALGFVALAYALAVASIEGREAYLADRSSERARMETAEASRSVESERRNLRRGADFLVATASVESSPDRVWRDLEGVLPEGVSLVTLKLDYTGEATARLELGVVARGPDVYDRFLEALSKSPRFGDIRPGSESRPGLVRATVSAIHRPREGAR